MQNERLLQKLIDDYWLGKLQAAAPAHRKGPVKKIGSVRTGIGRQALADLWTMTRGNAFGEFVVLLAGYSILLRRYFRVTDLLICSADIDAEPAARKQDHLLWYVVRPDPGMTVKTLVQELRTEVERVMGHRNFDYAALRSGIESRHIAEADLLQFGCRYNRVNGHSKQLHESSFRLVIHKDDHGDLQLELVYDAGMFDPQLGSGFLAHYSSFLTNVAACIDTPIDHLSFLSADEGERIRNFNDPPVKQAPFNNIVDLFRSRVAEYPDRPALQAGANRYTYAQLDEKSDQLARCLHRQHRVVKGRLIALVTDKTEWMIIAMLAILKSGGAFVPIDPDQPDERLREITEDAGVDLMLLESANMFRFGWFTGGLVVTDIQTDASISAPDMLVQPDGDDIAYVIYTSGTTGRPKGVMIDHQSVVNYATWLTEDLGVGPADSSLVMASLAFDLGYTSVWGTLLAGGALHLIDQQYGNVPDKLLAYLAGHQVSFIKTTPSLFYMLTHVPSFRSGEPHLSLRLIILGGEMIRKEDLTLYAGRYPSTQFINHYGPTESTVGCIFNRVEQGKATDPWSDLPVIGRPVRNAEVFITDDNGSLTPIGLEGELCIGGVGLARGYLNNVELTAARFVPHPFDPGRRIYRTGDYGRFAADGRIILHGRKDRQVKIRGYRVELIEIEKALKGHNAVENALVIPETGAGGHIRLIAYYVAAAQLDEGILKEHLARLLPEYMIPALFIHLDSMPLTANGKIDVRLLPRPAVHPPAAAGIPPANKAEALILSVWQEVLGKTSFGVRDNFFDIGGNSLYLVQVSSMLADSFPELSIVDMFNYTTVEKLAGFITERDSDGTLTIPGSSLPLPPGYFNQGDTENTDLQFRLDGRILTEVASIARSQGLTLWDVAASIFAYTIAGMSGEDRITLYILHQQGGLLSLFPIQLDFSLINDPAELFSVYLDRRSVVSPAVTVPPRKLRNLRFTSKSASSVVPLIGRKTWLQGIQPAPDGFDVVMEIDDGDDLCLNGVLAYSARLNPSFMKGWVHSYVNNLSSLAATTV